jgi:hypothetical protein
MEVIMSVTQNNPGFSDLPFNVTNKVLDLTNEHSKFRAVDKKSSQELTYKKLAIAIIERGKPLDMPMFRTRYPAQVPMFATPGAPLQHREIALHAVKVEGYVLWRVAPGLQDDHELVTEAVKNHAAALQFASERLRSDVDMVCLAIKTDPSVFGCAAGEALQDRSLVMAAVGLDGENLRHARSFQDDIEVVKAAVQNNPDAMRHASVELQVEHGYRWF